MAKSIDRTPVTGDRRDYHKPRSVDDLTERNVDTILKLEEAAKEQRTRSAVIADAISGFCGSITFVWVHIIWFTVWIAANQLPHAKHFDPFPYSFLTLIVSLEAIFLSTFILISQNRENLLTDRRNHLNLQVSLLSEQENTKMLQMLEQITHHLGLQAEADPDVGILAEATQPDRLLEQIEDRIERDEKGEREK